MHTGFGRKLQGRPRFRWEDRIKMDLKRVRKRRMDWILLAWELGKEFLDAKDHIVRICPRELYND
jgi:hypothetical protein